MDEQDPKNYYVFPGVAGNSYIEIIYSKNPATVTASDNLTVDDMYAGAVMHYVLYMSYLKESEVAANAQRAANHYRIFLSLIGAKDQRDLYRYA